MRVVRSAPRAIAVGSSLILLFALVKSSAFQGNAPATPGDREGRCAELKTAKNLPNATTVILAAVFNPASSRPAANPNATVASAVPAHCEVFGAINQRTGIDGRPYAIKFHLRLPAEWNGRLYFQGGGGSNGVVANALGIPADQYSGGPLALGYAVVAQDSGHDNAVNNDPAHGGELSFGWDPQARIDFAYNSYIEVTNTAKALIKAYYGQAPTKSYYSSCSEGGREGMMMSQRFPEAFDGIVARAPVIHVPQIAVAGMWDVQALAAIARAEDLVDANGQPAINKTFTDSDLRLVSNAVLAACDTLDGLADGMIQNFTACTTARVKPKLAAITCRAAKNDSCVSTAQVTALEKIIAGPRTSSGVQIYPGLVWDAGIGSTIGGPAANWRSWQLGAYDSPVNSAQHIDFHPRLFGNVWSAPPIAVASANGAAAAYALRLRMDDAMRLLSNRTELYPSALDVMKADSVDLSAFKKRGGKLIILSGVSDPGVSILDLTKWWNDVNRVNSGHAADFVRLFAVPGMNHCAGGVATSQVNSFGAAVEWVEKGVAPDRMIGTAPPGTPWPERTRPLCVYPAYARYKGTGSTEDAANFVCRHPQ